MIKVYVDSNHSVNKANRRAYHGIIKYVNKAPIIWYSKYQNKVEASSFESVFFALKIATETIEYLRYKLGCIGVKVDGQAEAFF